MLAVKGARSQQKKHFLSSNSLRIFQHGKRKGRHLMVSKYAKHGPRVTQFYLNIVGLFCVTCPISLMTLWSRVRSNATVQYSSVHCSGGNQSVTSNLQRLTWFHLSALAH